MTAASTPGKELDSFSKPYRLDSMKRIPRTESVPSKYRWLAYATAGAATGLAGLPSAEVEIHYSGPVNLRFGSHRSKDETLPLVNGAVLEFERDLVFGQASDRVGIKGAAILNAVRGNSPFASKLLKGDIISQRLFTNVNTGSMPALAPISHQGYFVSAGQSFQHGRG